MIWLSSYWKTDDCVSTLTALCISVTIGAERKRKMKKNIFLFYVIYWHRYFLLEVLFLRNKPVRYSILFFHSNRKYEHTEPVQLGIFPTTNFLQSCKLTLGGDITSTWPGCCIILGMWWNYETSRLQRYAQSDVIMYTIEVVRYICNCSVLWYFCRMNFVDCRIKSIFYVTIFCTDFFIRQS